MNRPTRMSRLRFALAGLCAIALVVLSISVVSLSTASAQDSTPPASGTPSAASCDTEAAIAAAPSSYAIVSEESVARYRAQEELVSVGANEAVGETKAIIGTILLDEDGTPLICSRFDVDLRTL